MTEMPNSAEPVYVAIAFYVLAAVAVLGGLFMVSSRDMVRSALSLVLTLGSIAGLYVLLSADFLAVVQVLVYVGAIMILMLFAIMLTPGQVELPVSTQVIQKGIAGLVAVLMGVISLFVVTSTPWSLRPNPLDQETSARLGELMLTDFVLPFEIASLVLTAGLIGALVIARED